MKTTRAFTFIVVALMLVTTAFASEQSLSTDEIPIQLNSNIRAIDTTFDLDFEESPNWYIDFDNEAGWFKFNHKYVDVYYDGFANTDSSTSVPVVTVQLKKLVDGAYEIVETKTTYPSNTYTFTLPNGGTLTDYRLSFACSKDTVCTFSVTSRN